MTACLRRSRRPACGRRHGVRLACSPSSPAAPTRGRRCTPTLATGIAADERAGRPAAPGSRHAAPAGSALRQRARPAAAGARRVGARPVTTRTSPPTWTAAIRCQRCRAFCRSIATSSIELLATRSTQTNEIGRCALFLPAFGLARRRGRPARPPRRRRQRRAQPAARPVPATRYEPGGTVGGPSPVRADLRHAGRRPGPGRRCRRSSSGAGLDRAPIDVHDEAQRSLARGLRLARPDRPVRTPAGRARARRGRGARRPDAATPWPTQRARSSARRRRPPGRDEHVGTQLPDRRRAHAPTSAALDALGRAVDLSWVYAESPVLVPELPGRHRRRLRRPDRAGARALARRAADRRPAGRRPPPRLLAALALRPVIAVALERPGSTELRRSGQRSSPDRWWLRPTGGSVRRRVAVPMPRETAMAIKRPAVTARPAGPAGGDGLVERCRSNDVASKSTSLTITFSQSRTDAPGSTASSRRELDRDRFGVPQRQRAARPPSFAVGSTAWQRKRSVRSSTATYRSSSDVVAQLDEDARRAPSAVAAAVVREAVAAVGGQRLAIRWAPRLAARASYTSSVTASASGDGWSPSARTCSQRARRARAGWRRGGRSGRGRIPTSPTDRAAVGPGDPRRARPQARRRAGAGRAGAAGVGRRRPARPATARRRARPWRRPTRDRPPPLRGRRTVRRRRRVELRPRPAAAAPRRRRRGRHDRRAPSRPARPATSDVDLR